MENQSYDPKKRNPPPMTLNNNTKSSEKSIRIQTEKWRSKKYKETKEGTLYNMTKYVGAQRRWTLALAGDCCKRAALF